MKMIIDIDEDYYEAICKRAEHFGRGSAILPPLEKIIFNGTPLEEELKNIKDEIKKKHRITYCNINCYRCKYKPCFNYETNNIVKVDLKILDKRIAELTRKETL